MSGVTGSTVLFPTAVRIREASDILRGAVDEAQFDVLPNREHLSCQLEQFGRSILDETAPRCRLFEREGLASGSWDEVDPRSRAHAAKLLLNILWRNPMGW